MLLPDYSYVLVFAQIIYVPLVFLLLSRERSSSPFRVVLAWDVESNEMRFNILVYLLPISFYVCLRVKWVCGAVMVNLFSELRDFFVGAFFALELL